jgi:hypothetical protein
MDLSNIVWVLNNNDNAASSDLNNNYLFEVTSYTENSDGTFSCDVEGQNETKLELSSGDLVYYLNIRDKDISRFCTADETWYVNNSLIYDTVEETEDGYTVTIGDKTLDVKTDDEVYSVTINDYDSYTITYSDDETETQETVPCITVDYKNGSDFNLTVKTTFYKTFEDFTLNYVTILPTDNVYYNAYEGIFLKNVSDSFDINFMIGNKLIVVCLSMTVFLLLLGICWRNTDYKILGDGRTFKVNFVLIVFSLLALVLMTLVTL